MQDHAGTQQVFNSRAKAAVGPMLPGWHHADRAGLGQVQRHPSDRSGVATRSIGRPESEASPNKVASMPAPARMPACAIRRPI